MQKIRAWGASAAGKPLAPMTVERREPGARDVVLERVLKSDVRYRFVIDIASLRG